MEESKPSIPFTPFRVAVFTGLVVFASFGAPHLATFRDDVKNGIQESLAASSPPASARSAHAPLIRYKDDRGRTNYVSTLDAVPSKFREKAEQNVRLPKVTYQDMPILPAAPLQRASNSSPRVTRAASDGTPPRERRHPRGRSSRPATGEQGTDSNRPDTARSTDEGTLDYIKKWLLFTRDTFNGAAVALGGEPGKEE